MADDGSKCDVKFGDDEVCCGILHRFLRVPCVAKRKLWANEQTADGAPANDASADSPKRVRKGGKLRLSPYSQRRKTGADAAEELRLVKLDTSHYNNNCLAFSIMMASKQLPFNGQESFQVGSDMERRLTHD